MSEAEIRVNRMNRHPLMAAPRELAQRKTEWKFNLLDTKNVILEPEHLGPSVIGWNRSSPI